MVDPTAPPLWRRATARARRRWRGWLRACHRDVGYLLVGLTVVYAVSGIAINHVGDWDPNFKVVETHTQVEGPFDADEETATRHVLSALDIRAEPRDFFYEGDRLEIYFDNQTILVDTVSGDAVAKAERARWFLRVANWLHYNRGKAAWTYVADFYAGLLLFLAFSGLLLNKGRKGLVGRGAILLVLGAAVPFLYVQMSGGP